MHSWNLGDLYCLNVKMSDQVEEKMAQVFLGSSVGQSWIMGALSNIDQNVQSPQVRIQSETAPGTSRESNSENQETIWKPIPEVSSNWYRYIFQSVHFHFQSLYISIDDFWPRWGNWHRLIPFFYVIKFTEEKSSIYFVHLLLRCFAKSVLLSNAISRLNSFALLLVSIARRWNRKNLSSATFVHCGDPCLNPTL